MTVFALLMLAFLPAVPASALAPSPTAPGTGDPAPAEASGIGIRLLDIPEATQSDPRARSYIVDHLQPGTTIKRRIQVQNNTNSPQSVHLYPGAARIEDGSFIGDDGAAKNELTTWISLDQTRMDMAAGENTEVFVTITVPSDASEAEQYAAVWAEVRAPANAESNIVSASRVGIRVYLSVGPGNGPPTDFDIDSLTAGRNPDGQPEVTATVTNTGGRALDISGSLSLEAGPGNLSAGPFPVDNTTTIAPNASSEVSIALDRQVPNGPWKARMELKSGLVTHEATADITFPDAGKGNPVQPNKGPHTALIAGSIAVIVLIAIATLVWFHRRRKLSTK